MEESTQKEIVLNDVPLKEFKLVMRYIYTGQLKMENLDVHTILETLGVAHLYGLEKLTDAICAHLGRNLTEQNVLKIYKKAQNLHIGCLSSSCFGFMDATADEVLKSDDFYDLSAAALLQILLRDTFYAKEIEIFEAVRKWCAKRPQTHDVSEILGAIRFPLIATRDLVTTVEDSGLIAKESVQEAIRTRKRRALDLKPRVRKICGVNLAAADRGVLKLTGHGPDGIATLRSGALIESEPMPSILRVGKAMGLTVDLNESYLINNISFKLPGENKFECSYYVEGSINLKDWFKLVDHSECSCRSLQRLLFEPRGVRYLRLIVIESSQADPMDLSSLVVEFTEQDFKIIHRFLAPERNVASEDLGAAVIEGTNENGSCINGNDSGETWTFQSTGAITIRLLQPYTVGSIRMRAFPQGFSSRIEISLGAPLHQSNSSNYFAIQSGGLLNHTGRIVGYDTLRVHSPAAHWLLYSGRGS